VRHERGYDTGERLCALYVASVGGDSVTVVAGDRVECWDLATGARPCTPPGASRTWALSSWPGHGAPIAAKSLEGEITVWDTVTVDWVVAMYGRCGHAGRATAVGGERQWSGPVVVRTPMTSPDRSCWDRRVGAR
jgi:hypothetical protein